MPKIMLNDKEYSGGSSANIDITTTLTEDTVSDTSVPSSKVVYDELSEKANVDNATFTSSVSMGRTSDSEVGTGSVALGTNVTASGVHAYAEGYNTMAIGGNSHAEGSNTTALGHQSHAEGASENKALDYITSGNTNDEIIDAWESTKFSLAKGGNSHLEGVNNLSLGICSHSEGYMTIANGSYSHTEGNGAKAMGGGSHAEGNYTIASGDYSHVQGKYNIEDTTNTYAHIVGNGTSDANRSNAHTLDWSGNGWYKGDLYVGGTSQADANTVIHSGNVVTTLDSTVTNSQVPSAKTVYDELAVRNIKTYTRLDQLGLTSPTTVSEIFNAMPVNSYLELPVHREEIALDGFAIVSDLPSDSFNNSEPYGALLTIRKRTHQRFSITCTASRGDAVAPNLVYTGQLKGNDGTGITWSGVCTTTVSDVETKTLTVNDWCNANITYRVVNGIAYVTMYITSDTMSTQNQVVPTTLPKSALGGSNWFSLSASADSTQAPIQNLLVKVSAEGEVSTYSGTNGVGYFGTFCYPVLSE